MDKPTEREQRYEKALRHLAETAFATKDWRYARAALGTGPLPEPCPRGRTRQADHDCMDRHQCWEPCGELGKSEEHVRPGREPTPLAFLAGRFGLIPVPALPREKACPACGSPPGVHALSCKNWAGSTDPNWRER